MPLPVYEPSPNRSWYTSETANVYGSRPVGLVNTRWNSELSRLVGNDGVTRGCRTAYPSITRPVGRSSLGWLSGCAIFPIRRFAAPRGSRVSASNVITYRTAGGGTGRMPPTGTNVVLVAPRSQRFNSCSFPRLRSQPIHE